MMIKLAIASLLVLALPVNAYELPLRYVYDGDTIMVYENNLPTPLNKVSIRLRGVDTPEILGRCAAETQKAYDAKAFVKSFIGEQTRIPLTNYKWDKVGGRIDADIIINNVSLADALLANGLAVPYNGTGKRKNWCI